MPSTRRYCESTMPSTPLITRHLLWTLALVLVFLAGLVKAEVPRALPEGKVPNDKRLGPLKDLDGYFPFTPSKNKDEWEKRAEQVRRRILVANGLWPMPVRTP